MCVRTSVHRGKSGFLVYGKDTHNLRIRIFTESQSSAQHIQKKIRAGKEIDVKDFDS